ncbi:MAG: hypothetical protein ACXVQJ_09735 [Actinomycetota bacterium]
MSDIEERIRSALRPYRAAENLPGRMTPGRARRSLTKPTARGRTLVVVLAAAVLVTVTTVALAGLPVFDDETPPPLQQSIEDIFAGGRCVTGAEATQRISEGLAALGYNDWVIESRPGAESDRCVVAGFVVTKKQVVLLPASGPTVSAAIQGVAATLMSECLSKDDAIALVTSVLSGIGQTDFTISTDGPVGYPLGQQDAVRSHIASGCVVYSATGWDANGRPVYYISGSGA